MNPLSRGLLEMLGVVGAFLALGLLGPEVAASGPGGRPARVYAPGMAAGPAGGTVWLVDGYNVLCSGLLGRRERSRWWSEERRAELLRALEGFEDPEVEIWVVFDGEREPEPADVAAGRVRTVFAPSADAWLVDEVKRRAGEDREVTVVTADRKLAGRSRHRGARVVAPRELLGRCMS